MVEYMPDTELSKLVRWNSILNDIRVNNKPLLPFANQILFLRSTELELLYGGAARGGKSIAMLMAALQYVDIPGYHALILRKNFAELNLAGALIPVSKEWLTNTNAKWSEVKNTWTFPSGATLTFGYLENKNDVYRYLGSEYQFIGFDELTEQPIENYLFLFTRLVLTKEMTAKGVPLRMRATTNPGGEYAEWVFERFIDKTSRRKYWDKAMNDISAETGKDKEKITEEEILFRVPKFIPSNVFDNPHVDHAKYVASLSNVDPVRRAQYLEGDWSIRAMGNMFNRNWFGEPVPPATVDVNNMKILRYWDLAATEDESADYTATCKMGYDKSSGYYYILDFELCKESPHIVEELFKAKQKFDKIKTITVMEQEPGAGGKNSIDNYKRKVSLPGYMFIPDKVTGSKEDRARPLSAAIGNGMIKIMDYPKRKQWYGEVMNQLEAFPMGLHDDAVDCMAGCYNMLSKFVFTDTQFVGKLDYNLPDENDNPYLPSYAQSPKGKKVVNIILGGRAQDMFRRDNEDDENN